MNPVVKAIGRAFQAICSRMEYGAGARAGDFTALSLPEDVDPRLRRGQVIRIHSSAGHQVAWHYVCGSCGTTN